MWILYHIFMWMSTPNSNNIALIHTHLYVYIAQFNAYFLQNQPFFGCRPHIFMFTVSADVPLVFMISTGKPRWRYVIWKRCTIYIRRANVRSALSHMAVRKTGLFCDWMSTPDSNNIALNHADSYAYIAQFRAYFLRNQPFFEFRPHIFMFTVSMKVPIFMLRFQL